MSDVDMGNDTPKQFRRRIFFLAIGAFLEFISPFVLPGTVIFVLTAMAVILTNGFHPAWCAVLLLVVISVFQWDAYQRLKSIYRRDIAARERRIRMLEKDYHPKPVKRIRGFKAMDTK